MNNLPDEYDDEEEDADDGNRVECRDCGRKFNPDRIAKHSKICKKVFIAKRKTFDMKKKRVIDSEHAMMLKNQEYQEKKKGVKGMQNVKKPAKWKKQSEEFRAIMRVGKTTDNFTVPQSSIYIILT